MRIEKRDKEPQFVRYGGIEFGECFTYRDIFFIVTNIGKAVNLENGVVCSFSPNDIVERIYAKVVIEE